MSILNIQRLLEPEVNVDFFTGGHHAAGVQNHSAVSAIATNDTYGTAQTNVAALGVSTSAVAIGVGVVAGEPEYAIVTHGDSWHLEATGSGDFSVAPTLYGIAGSDLPVGNAEQIVSTLASGSIASDETQGAPYGTAGNPSLTAATGRPANPATQLIALPGLDEVDPRINQWAFENLNAPNYEGFVSQFRDFTPGAWSSALENRYGMAGGWYGAPVVDSGIHSPQALVGSAMDGFLSGAPNQHLFSFYVLGMVENVRGPRVAHETQLAAAGHTSASATGSSTASSANGSTASTAGTSGANAQTPTTTVRGDAAHPTLPTAPRPMNPSATFVALPALDALDPRINQWAFENLNAPNYAGFVSQFQNRNALPWNPGLESHYGTITPFDYQTRTFGTPRDSGIHSQADIARAAMTTFLSGANINQHLFSYYVIGTIDGCFSPPPPRR